MPWENEGNTKLCITNVYLSLYDWTEDKSKRTLATLSRTQSSNKHNNILTQVWPNNSPAGNFLLYESSGFHCDANKPAHAFNTLMTTAHNKPRQDARRIRALCRRVAPARLSPAQQDKTWIAVAVVVTVFYEAHHLPESLYLTTSNWIIKPFFLFRSKGGAPSPRLLDIIEHNFCLTNTRVALCYTCCVVCVCVCLCTPSTISNAQYTIQWHARDVQ